MRVWILLLVVFVCVINSSSAAKQKAWFRCLRQSTKNITVELYIDRDEQGPDIKYLIGRLENGRTCSYTYERPLKIRVSYSQIVHYYHRYNYIEETKHDTCGVTDLGNNTYKIDLFTAGIEKMETTYDRRYTFKCHFTEPMPYRAKYQSSFFMKIVSNIRSSTEKGKAVPIVSPPKMEIIGKNGTKKDVITLGEPVRLRISIKVGEGELVATGFRVYRCNAVYGGHSLELIRKGCSVPIRGVIAANEGFVKNSEMSTGDLFVSDGPWFHSFRLIKDEYRFVCSMHLCYGRNSSKCDQSCGVGVTTSASTVMNLTDVNSLHSAAVGVTVRRCDAEVLAKCSDIFRFLVSKFITEETKAKKYPKTCKAIENFIICANPALEGCNEELRKSYKRTVEIYRKAPLYCQLSVSLGDAITTEPNV